ncbi:MHYT domain-containing protein [Streptomyces sp. NPDC096033]|uniref:MHYT domain-containing protein n=1 Tax=Streptomyces sp. NPDC096033 TaxID=3366071 RepID=UPI0037FE9474
MGHLDHAAYGWLTPVLSYVMATIGAALGLRCTVRALAATGPSRRNWLLTAASAFATCIWTMHFIAMLGFHITGTEIHYNVPLTLLSLLVALLVVGAGLFAVGYGRDRGRSLVLGGLTTGLGVASMHYLGMAALRLHGRISYDPLIVGISVALAVVAATAALWAALHIRSPLAVAGASLLMGGAVSSMHYTGMMAVGVRVTPSAQALPGATALQFIFPLAVGLGSYLFITAAFVALSPTADERAAFASASASASASVSLSVSATASGPVSAAGSGPVSAAGSGPAPASATAGPRPPVRRAEPTR